jgi:hypothetical protein
MLKCRTGTYNLLTEDETSISEHVEVIVEIKILF